MSLKHLNKEFENFKLNIKPPTEEERNQTQEIIKQFNLMVQRKDFNELKNYLTKKRHELRNTSRG